MRLPLCVTKKIKSHPPQIDTHIPRRHAIDLVGLALFLYVVYIHRQCTDEGFVLRNYQRRLPRARFTAYRVCLNKYTESVNGAPHSLSTLEYIKVTIPFNHYKPLECRVRARPGQIESRIRYYNLFFGRRPYIFIVVVAILLQCIFFWVPKVQVNIRLKALRTLESCFA